jgi:predicted nucleic acid-binding protein
MRVVIDTGVFNSASVASDLSSTPRRSARCTAMLGAVCALIAALMMEVIDRPYLARLIAPAARARLAELMAAAELVAITERIALCRDPKG